MEVYNLSYSYFSETGQNRPDWFGRPKWAWKWLQTRNMALIILVKDSISFPGTPRSSNLDIKWRSYSRLKLIKVNFPENENREKRPKLGLLLHAILKMKMTSNGKMQRMKVVEFWVRRKSRPISTHSDL